ncbi:nuclear transport factor 2 family protein [Streptomyces sp. NPDC004787]|uniref:nuclear transport factor 2 family protein n=1 Tax=Streptomyces sp. NPDC004787 TaxID=3154291 RepID=UPI0033B204AE
MNAYQRRDLNALCTIFSRPEDAAMSDLQEELYFLGWRDSDASLVRQLSAIEGTEIRITQTTTRVSADGTKACAHITTDYRGKTSGHDAHLDGLQLTLTLEHDGCSWRIAHARWSVPANSGCPQNPLTITPATASQPPCDNNQAPCGRAELIGPATDAAFPSGATEAFTVYQQLAATVTQRLNNGTFDFDSDIAPHTDEKFIEIADTAPLDLAKVKATFAPVIDAVAAGASFSWSVQLEHARDLAPDLTLLITNALVSLTPSEGKPETKRYRITNILCRNASGAWIFIHQHRTEMPV